MHNSTIQGPNSDRVMTIVKDVVRALVDYANNGTFKNPKFKNFRLEKNQKVKIDDLLRIFVDNPDYYRDFLQFVITDYGKEDFKKKGLSDIKLHHRLLECYLYKNQDLKIQIESRDPDQVDPLIKKLRVDQGNI